MNGRDPVVLAALLALVVVGAVAIVDILADGTLDPGVLALLVAVAGPIMPVLISRSRNGRK